MKIVSYLIEMAVCVSALKNFLTSCCAAASAFTLATLGHNDLAVIVSQAIRHTCITLPIYFYIYTTSKEKPNFSCIEALMAYTNFTKDSYKNFERSVSYML